MFLDSIKKIWTTDTEAWANFANNIMGVEDIPNIDVEIKDFNFSVPVEGGEISFIFEKILDGGSNIWGLYKSN